VAVCSYNPALPGAQTFTIDGTVTLPAGVVNPDGLALTVAISVTVDAAAVVIDPNNNAAIGGGPRFDLGQNKTGAVWSWNAAAKTLTLTGSVSAIDITAAEGVTIALAGSVSAGYIAGRGAGSLTITGGPDNIDPKLTLNSVSGPAISAEGGIIIAGGQVDASAADASAAIVSLAGSVSVTGSANVKADSRAGGSAIKAAADITISTTGEVAASASGTGYALDAGNAITITGGTTELYAADTDIDTDKTHAFSVTPNISGADTFVYINGSLYYGAADITPRDEGKPENSGGGCDAGFGAAGMMVLLIGVHSALRRKTR
jgi:hypothetical protein